MQKADPPATEFCKFFLKDGVCPFGEKCEHPHVSPNAQALAEHIRDDTKKQESKEEGNKYEAVKEDPKVKSEEEDDNVEEEEDEEDDDDDEWGRYYAEAGFVRRKKWRKKSYAYCLRPRGGQYTDQLK